MSPRGKPELRDRLAAEYALGTLRGPARARFARWLREDADLRRAVGEWEARLAPLAVAVAERRPPRRVWEAIAARIAPAGPAPAGLWDRVGFWRALGLSSSGMAAALLALALMVEPPRGAAPPPVVVQVPARDVGAAYFALLSDPKTQKPVLLVSAGRRSTDLLVKTLDPGIRVPERSLELWALPPNAAPRSLGVLDEKDRLQLRLRAVADESLGDVPALAVSLEPRGGSPTGAPTGPVLFSGPCVRTW